MTKTNEEDKNKPASESGVDNPSIPPQETAAQGFPQQQAGSQGFPQQQWQPQPIYQDVQVVPPNRIIFAVPKWMVFTAAAIIGILFVIAGGFLGDKIDKAYWSGQMIPNITFSAVGKDGWEFFKKYDRDGDLKLSLDEYEAIYHTLVANGINVTTDLHEKLDYSIDKDDQKIKVQAYFKPLLLDTMNTDLNDTSENLDSLIGLQSWKTLNKESITVGVKQFKGFLPPNNTYIDKLCDVYKIYNINSTSLPDIPSHTSSNKYQPPMIEDELVIIHHLLTMFHPRPFLRSRFPPQGGVACVRAFNKDYLDISYRIHAEFQLSEPPHNPMWFTPGQFTGNLIISRDYKKILNFHMYVPTDKRLNVDMEWITDVQTAASMQVDIGFLPQMEIKLMAPTNEDLEKKVQGIKWTKEVSQTEARRKLEIKMYPFKQVPYYNFTDSFEKAHKDQKLVHSILLWGALDDQSC